MAGKLIELVKKYPILYDTRHNDYRNTQKREEIWEEIGYELGDDGDITKSKWKNMRDSYVKYLRGLSDKSVKGRKKNYKNWKWAAEMKYFQPYLGLAKHIDIMPTKYEGEDDVDHIDQISEPEVSLEDISNLDTIKVETIDITDLGTTEVKAIDTSNLDTTEVETIDNSNLETMEVKAIDTSNLDTIEVETINTSNLETIEVKAIDTSHLDTIEVETIDTSNFGTIEVKTIDTSKLKTIEVKMIDISNLDAIEVESIDTNTLENIEAETINTSLSLEPSSSHITTRRKRKRNNESANSRTSTERDNFQSKRKHFEDPIDLAFRGYAQAIKQFSPERQAYTKIQIAKIMAQQELDHLQEQES